MSPICSQALALFRQGAVLMDEAIDSKIGIQGSKDQGLGRQGHKISQTSWFGLGDRVLKSMAAVFKAIGPSRGGAPV